MKTRNFVLEWFEHQARLKEDKTRMLFDRPTQDTIETLTDRQDETPGSDEDYEVTAPYLTQP